MHVKLFASAATACAVLASVLVAPVAHAASGEPWEAAAAVAAYLRDYPGLTPSQARSAYVGQAQRIRMLEKIQAQQVDGFGGSWYDPRTNTQHINSVGEAFAQTARTLGGDLGLTIVTHPVKYTVKELKAQAAQTQAKVDVVNNRLVAAPAQERSGLDACTDRFNCGKPLRGGLVLWNTFFGRANPLCSSGFTARATDGSKWVFTAGHCANPSGEGITWAHGDQGIGPIKYFVNAGNVDVARIHVRNSYWSTGGYIFNDAAPDSPLAVNGAIEYRDTIQPGDSVCLAAWHSTPSEACGTIVDSYSVDGMPSVTFDACQGDSGGGWYYAGPSGGERIAYCIHHGWTGPGPGTNCHMHAIDDSLFTAVPDMNAYWDSTASATIRVEVR